MPIFAHANNGYNRISYLRYHITLLRMKRRQKPMKAHNNNITNDVNIRLCIWYCNVFGEVCVANR